MTSKIDNTSSVTAGNPLKVSSARSSLSLSLSSTVAAATATATTTGHVLYMDDQNHLVPLLQCYHSTASRSLCSISNNSYHNSSNQRYPTTTVPYIDSYYCTNCFTYYDPLQSISAPIYGCCIKCYNCPFCFNNCITIQYDETDALTTTTTSSETDDTNNNNNNNNINGTTSTMQTFICYYKCHNCDYTSMEHCYASSSISVILSLILPIHKNEAIVDSNTINNNEISSSSSSSSSVPTTTFTKWESLQSAATEMLGTMIRQRYYTTASSSSSATPYVSLVEQWKVYYQQQQQQRRRTHDTSKSQYNVTTAIRGGKKMLPLQQQQEQHQPNNNHPKWSIVELETKFRWMNHIPNQLHSSSLLPPMKDHKTIDTNETILGSHILPSQHRTSIHDIIKRKVSLPMQQPNQTQSTENCTTTGTTSSSDSNSIVDSTGCQIQYKQWENISLVSYVMQSMLFDNNNNNNCTATTTATAAAIAPTDSVMSYYPIPRSLNIRYSYRSKKDVLIHHRPGIVLKPKLNPLDGDSSFSNNNSLSSSIGQWYRKDSSAIYTIPSVHVIQEYKQYNTQQKKHTFLLQVSNPTLGPIRLRLLLLSNQSLSSKYHDEFNYWNDNDTATIAPTTAAAATATATFRNVLLDPLHQTIADQLQVVGLSTTESELTSETMEKPLTIELQSIEDSILLDYPSSSTTTSRDSHAIPDIVQQWNSNKTVHGTDHVDDDDTNNNNRLRFIAQNASTVWYELLVVEPVVNNEGTATGNIDATSSSSSSLLLSYCGIPLVLEIDVGNGSWESSLIPVNNEVHNDMVRFDLVVAFPYHHDAQSKKKHHE